MNNRRHGCHEPSLFETIIANKDNLTPSMKTLVNSHSSSGYSTGLNDVEISRARISITGPSPSSLRI
jgi:hypothetical protein